MGKQTYMEPAQEVKICDHADVLVVGGGPGGHSAAIAAAREGARVILMERYGYFGGMATGALVIMLPQMSWGTKDILIRGLAKEWLDRLDERKAALHPDYADLGSTDPQLAKYWRSQGPFFYTPEGNLRLVVFFDPEMLVCILNEMVEEAKVKPYLHSWCVKAITEGGRVKGVIFESKSGRQAITADVVIDASGDGDLLPSAGAEFDKEFEIHLRQRNMAVPFTIGGIDGQKFRKFKAENPVEFTDIVDGSFQNGGFSVTTLNGYVYDNIAWVNNFIPGMGFPMLDSTNVRDLTLVEMSTRKRILKTILHYRDKMPGFENAYILRSASQLGVRGGRRLVGEYVLEEMDINTGRLFDDTIVVGGPFKNTVSPKHPMRSIPYRCLVPKEVDGLLVAGRIWSARDVVGSDHVSMPYCSAFGQAAGIAAAQAVKTGKEVRNIDIKALQDSLRKQGCYLPDNETISKINGFPTAAKTGETKPEIPEKK